MNDFSWLIERLYTLPGILIGLSFHEFAHALAAYWLGDRTAKDAGRLTIEPIAHIDPIGFLLLFIARFGWAKPVPVNPMNFKNRRFGMLIVSFAGPIMNLFLAFITLVIYFLLQIFNLDNQIVMRIIEGIFVVNVSLFVFNLLPVPPLDGSKILASILPANLEEKFYQIERYTYIALMLLLVSNKLNIILNPLFDNTVNALQAAAVAVVRLF